MLLVSLQRSYCWVVLFSYLSEKVLAAVLSTSLARDGIIPTASGQIGVNPVLSDLGPETQYVGAIGPHTEVLLAASGVTKWIGKDPFFTQIDVTMTISNQAVATKTGVQLSAVTATASADGQEPGDVALAIGPVLKNKISDFAADAVAACKVVKRMKRDYGSDAFAECLAREAFESSGPGGPLEAELVELDTLLPAVPESVSIEFDIIAALYTIAKTQARRKAFWFLKIGATLWAGSEVVPWVWNFLKSPKGLITPSPTSAILTGCAAGAPTGINLPFCPSDDCQELPEYRKCTTGNWKSCDCALGAKIVAYSGYDNDWLNQQQEVLGEIDGMADPPPNCTFVPKEVDFDGNSRTDPESWCRCFDSWNNVWPVYSYSTIPSGSASPCGYTSLPAAQISVATKPLPTGVSLTSCRKVTLAPYTVTAGPPLATGIPLVSCTCNDNLMYPIFTRQTLGETVTLCQTDADNYGGPLPTPPITSSPSSKPWYVAASTVLTASL
ncbi:hypothetical protein BU16DRAFT_565398 [Lophium mytilinum]|uniref:Uncharacterized protein n=1 Tax=Lophium mytilinum TaxID=390894 RepID=A0A6A6QHX3_9PEZI|nr:hypothetical protein BU16DRAFT_565398 [Lophium mytilinum]